MNEAAFPPADKKPVVFARVKSITGIVIPPEEQTPKVREAFMRLLNHMDTDPLTELETRVRFTDKLKTKLRRMALDDKEAATPTTLVFCDLNHFKAINTVLGQEGGNVLIQAASKFIRAHTRQKAQPGHEIRATDIIGRHGGDEFILLLRNCNEEQARKCMERVASELRQETFRVGNDVEATNLGVSYGCYQIHIPDTQEREMFDYKHAASAMIAHADARMKEYKSTHREQPTLKHDGRLVWSESMAQDHVIKALQEETLPEPWVVRAEKPRRSGQDRRHLPPKG